ncbi:hypothetical protein VSR17_06510 [Cupriavidus taiwanensis]|uniref:hypothetical protein n=1 Tax=Cupriavidus taiwanensis TaxID=164546 RepID=UPI0018DC76B8|nr:hypothetical protein [Cupriavidus taiwanensis]
MNNRKLANAAASSNRDNKAAGRWATRTACRTNNSSRTAAVRSLASKAASAAASKAARAVASKVDKADKADNASSNTQPLQQGSYPGMCVSNMRC